MIMSSISRISCVCDFDKFHLIKKLHWKRNVIQYLTIDACVYLYIVMYPWCTLLNTYKRIRRLITHTVFHCTLLHISVW